MTNAAIYLRISQDHAGEGLAIQRQREACRAIAEQRGWTVLAEFEETASATSKKSRPEYQRLLAMAKARQVTAVVCWDLDRLTRKPRELEDWCDLAELQAVFLVTASGEADLSTDSGRLFARMKAAVSRSEMERKSARQAAAAKQRAELGRPPLGTRLLGYTAKGETISNEAGTVRMIFERFIAGESLRGICRLLDEKGEPTRHGGPWHPSSVRTILTNRRYSGRTWYLGKQLNTEVAWEAFISAEVFDAVQLKLSDPSRRKQYSTEKKRLGAGLWRCEVCSKPLQQTGTVYYCKGHLSRQREYVDDFVNTVIEERLSRPDVHQLFADSATNRDRLHAIERELHGLSLRTDVFRSDYALGQIDAATLTHALDTVSAQADSLTRERASLLPTSTSLALSVDPAAAFRSAPIATRQAIIRALCTVTLMKTGRAGGPRKAFDPASVRIDWHHA